MRLSAAGCFRAPVLVALAAITLFLPAASASRAKQARISVSLLGPAAGASVPWYGASPVFHWRVTTSKPPLQGTVWLEVSTTPSFKQEALQMFDCGYSPGRCVTSFEWPNRSPYWYDLSDSCADLPPSGSCGSPATVFYWRVRFEPPGGSRKISSRIGTIERAAPADTTAPSGKALAGTATYGAPARFFYYASDNSGVTRSEIELYDGATVVFGARDAWDRTDQTNERYVDQTLPTSVERGSYRWCLMVFDYSGNSTTSCAPYTITS